MSADTLVQAIMSTHSQVDFLWQFFVTVHIAIFALLFIYDHTVEALSHVARGFAVVGVAMFDWINGNALRNSYLLLDALHEQLRFQAGHADKYAAVFYDRFILSSFIDRPSLIFIVHLTAFAVVIIALLWRRFISHPVDPLRRPRLGE